MPNLSRSFAAALAAIVLSLALAPAPVSADPPLPERQASSPAISLIDAPTAVCYQSQTGECYLNWGSFYVDASPSYMTRFTLTIDNRVRALYFGFFQTYMSIEEGMHGMGFKVPCGGPSADVFAPAGRLHWWQASAEASDGGKTSSSGAVTCPPALYAFLPVVFRAR